MINVHKRCQKLVANNCGINTRQLADILNDMGMTPHKLTESSKPRKKVRSQTLWRTINIELWVVKGEDFREIADMPGLSRKSMKTNPILSMKYEYIEIISTTRYNFLPVSGKNASVKCPHHPLSPP